MGYPRKCKKNQDSLSKGSNQDEHYLLKNTLVMNAFGAALYFSILNRYRFNINMLLQLFFMT